MTELNCKNAKTGKKRYSAALIVLSFLIVSAGGILNSLHIPVISASNTIVWSEARKIYTPRLFNAYYPRPLLTSDKKLLVAFDTDEDSYGATKIKLIKSENLGETWSGAVVVREQENVTCATPSLLQTSNGEIWCFYRLSWKAENGSDWHTRIEFSVSKDGGLSWQKQPTGAVVDETFSAGRFGGIWEPHPYYSGTDLYVMYCDDSDRVDVTGSSQNILAKKWENGKWSQQIIVSAPGDSRDGMPVWTRLKDGRYIVVFESTDTQPSLFGLKYKLSPDGRDWTGERSILDTPNPGRVNNAPFITQLGDGRLLCTFQSDNDNQISFGTQASSSYAIEGWLSGSSVVWGTRYKLFPVPDTKWSTMPSSVDIGDGKILAFCTTNEPSPGLYMKTGTYLEIKSSVSNNNRSQIKESKIDSNTTSAPDNVSDYKSDGNISGSDSLKDYSDINSSGGGNSKGGKNNGNTLTIIFVIFVAIFIGVTAYLLYTVLKRLKESNSIER